MNRIERVLVLAPHTDDGEFGCGGSMSRFVDEGKEVYYAAFSTAEESVPDHLPKDILEVEVREATRRLRLDPRNVLIYKFQVRKLNYFRQEILDELVRLNRKIKPQLVFLPSPDDLHQDHHTVAMEGLRAFKQTTILGYEVPWNNINFKTQTFIRLSRPNIESKINALNAYKSQSHRLYASEDFIWSLSKTRGVQIGAQFAEVFEAIRLLI